MFNFTKCPKLSTISHYMFKNIAFFREGGWHEIIDSVVISEQETKIEGVQHVYNRRDNIDAALVCEDGLREHT